MNETGLAAQSITDAFSARQPFDANGLILAGIGGLIALPAAEIGPAIEHAAPAITGTAEDPPATAAKGLFSEIQIEPFIDRDTFALAGNTVNQAHGIRRQAVADAACLHPAA